MVDFSDIKYIATTAIFGQQGITTFRIFHTTRFSLLITSVRRLWRRLKTKSKQQKKNSM